MKHAAKSLIFLMGLVSSAASAQIIMCKDASGRTHTADRMIAECADRPTREFSSNGLPRREIPAPLTAEQKRQKQLEEEKRKAEEAVLAEKKRADRAMLTRYRNENDIEVARRQSLDMVNERVSRQKDALAAAEKQQKAVRTEMAQVKNKKDMPPGLYRRLEESDKMILNEKKKVEELEAEMAQVSAKYDATLKRFRELTIPQPTASK
jgi:DNA repair exonuclease SbcCD ATPase subunit